MADPNGDGYPEIFIMGTDGTTLKSILYKYDPAAKIFKIQPDFVIPGLANGSSDWGDFDGDGYLDLSIIGEGPGGVNNLLQIYRYGNASVYADLSSLIPNVGQGSVQWGDFEGDGDLDLLVGSANQVSVVENSAGIFSNIMYSIPGSGLMKARFGDLNADGGLDILTNSGLYRIFRNQVNNTPTVPTSLTSSVNGYQANLVWSAASDLETPVNVLTYNVQLMHPVFYLDWTITPPGEYFSVFPGQNMSSLPGNAGQVSSLKVNDLEVGDYQWRVQAVDASLKASDWSAFSNFSVVQQPPAAPYNLQGRVVNYTDVELSWSDASDDEDGFRLERSQDNYTWTQVADEGAGTGDLVFDITTYTDQGLALGTIYYYRVRSTNAFGQSAYSAVITVVTLSGNVGDPTAWAWATSAYGDAVTNVNDLDIALDNNLYITGSFTNYINVQSLTEGYANGDNDFFFADMSLGGNVNSINTLSNPSNSEAGLQFLIDRVNMQQYSLESFTAAFTAFGKTFTPINTSGDPEFLINGFPSYLDVAPLFNIQITNTGYKEGIFMEMLPDGNFIVAGNTKYAIYVGASYIGVSYTNNGFMAKIGPAGNIIWAINMFGTPAGYMNDMSIDGNGNIYIAGNYSSYIYINWNYYSSPGGGNEVFIAKFDPNGSLLWVSQSSGTGTTDQMMAVTTGNTTLGPEMGVYAAGIYSNSITYNGETLNTEGTSNSFLVKLNADGQFRWLKPVGNQTAVNDVVTYDIASDENENLYLTGYYSGTGYFSDRVINSQGDNDMFVARYDSSCQLLWMKSAGAESQERGRKITLDDKNDIYVSGTFRSSFPYFGPFGLSSFGDSNDDIFIAKLNQTNLLALPDLELKITSQFPDVVDRDNPQFTLNFTVWNRGEIASPGTNVQWFQSPDYWFEVTPNDNSQVGNYSLSSINPGDSVTFQETITPGSLQDRPHFQLYANYNLDFPELTRTNNYDQTAVDNNEPVNRVAVLQDSYIDQYNPAAYYGEMANMTVNENPDNSASRRGLIKFDIGHIRQTANYAKLQVYGKTDPSNYVNIYTFDVDLYSAGHSNWGSRLDPDSTLVTWNNSPPLGNWLASAVFSNAENYVEFINDTLTEYINNSILNGDSLISFYILGKNPTGTENVLVFTQETTGNSLLTNLHLDASPVDLKTTNSNLGASSVELGDPVNLYAEYYNESSLSLNMTARAAAYLSVDTILDAGDFELISMNIPDWCSYCYNYIDQEFIFDFTFNTGDYYVLFVTNPDNAINELLKSNNLKYNAITLLPGTAPDLAIINPNVTPGQVQPDNDVTVSCEIKNIGTADLISDTFFRLHLSYDTLLDGTDLLLKEISLGGLNAGMSHNISEVINMTSVAEGNYYILFYADAGNTELELSENNNFRNDALIVSWTISDIDKPVIGTITYNPTDPVAGFGNMTFTVDVNDDSPLNQVTFEYSAIMTDTSSWNSVNMNYVGGPTYSINILESSFQNVGLRYRVSATDNFGNTALTSTQYINLNKSTDSEYVQIGSTGNTQEAYRIISIPYELQNWSVSSIFEDDFGQYDITQWRLFRYAHPSYAEMNSGALLARGKGYFLISKSSSSFDVGPGNLPDEIPGEEFIIPLVSGWNLIGNPYIFDVLWDDILSYSNYPSGIDGQQPRSFNGQFQNTDGIKTKSGVFIFSEGPLNLFIPVVRGTIGSRIAESGTNFLKNGLHQTDWEVPLQLTDGVLINDFAGIGMRQDASFGHDKYDDYTLPRFQDYLELNHQGQKTAGVSFTKNIVPSDESYLWSFTVETGTTNKTITISWDNSYFGNEKNLTLIDMDNEVQIDMVSVNNYSFNARQINNFRIIYGNSDVYPFGLMKPAFPNPFEDHTQFGFILEKPWSKVNVKIFNSSGSQVNSIFDGELPEGYHEMTWNGQDWAGHKMPPGVYFAAFRVNSGEVIRNISMKIVKK
ncbi:MAG TPA: CARDB domain-containing protein [Cyclobacteriaceae bacterium]|nr:CARDB domain-containing protein [Cyclobacteriaceae bacterium]